jgi:hypothetical protein
MTFICIELPTVLAKAMVWGPSYFAMQVCCVPPPSLNIWSVRFSLINPVLKYHVQWWDVNILFRFWLHYEHACFMQLNVLLFGRKKGCSLLRGTPGCMQPSVAFHFAETYIHQLAQCSSHLHLDFVHVQTTCFTTQILWTAHFRSGVKWIVHCSISILPKQEFGVFTTMMIHVVIFWGMIMCE